MTITSLPSPDEKQVVVYHPDTHTLELAHLLHKTKTLLRHPCPPPCCIGWAPDSQTLAVALPGVGARLFLVSGGNTLLVCPDPGESPILSLCFSPDVTSLAVGKVDGEIRLLSLQENRWKPISGPRMHPSAVTALAFSPDGRLASVSLSGVLLLHDRSRDATPIGQCPLLVSELCWENERELNVYHQNALVQIIAVS